MLTLLSSAVKRKKTQETRSCFLVSFEGMWLGVMEALGKKESRLHQIGSDECCLVLAKWSQGLDVGNVSGSPT